MKGYYSKFWNWLGGNLLLIFTFAGVVIGIVLGLGLRNLEMDRSTIELIAYPGELFVRLIQMMILPLVINSLISGSASLNAKMSGMIAFRTFLYFVLTSLLSSCVGLFFVLMIVPGNTAMKTALGDGDTDEEETSLEDTFLDLGRNLFPDNLFRATFQSAKTNLNTETNAKELKYRDSTNMLGIISFSLAFGVVLGSVGKRAAGVIQFFSVLDEVIMSMVTSIMWISPIGICSVITAKILGVDDLDQMFTQLGMFLVTACGAIFFQQFTVLQAIYFVFVRKNPIKYWVNLFQAWMTAFATASTAAAMPIALQSLDRAGVDKRISRFVIPIGATVNMDGTALFVTIAAVFIAQLNNIPLNTGDFFTVVLTSTAASIASASVPSAALVLLHIVLGAIHVPIRDASLLWAVDWLIDRCRTTSNMLGDAYGAAVIEALSRQELKEMDSEQEVKDEEAQINVDKTASREPSIGSSATEY